jgi:hypothetical protein
LTTLPAGRYGSPRRWAGLSGRTWTALLTVSVVAAGFAVALLGYRNLGPHNIDWEVVNSQIVDNNRAMRITFTLTRKHPSEHVVCLIRVRDRSGHEVGRQVAGVPGSSSSTVTTTAVIATSGPPAVDELVGCGSKVPNDPATP